MGLKNRIAQIMNSSEYGMWMSSLYTCIKKGHLKREKRIIKKKNQPIYYIIGYEDPQSGGWTVWERVVLYGAIYAYDHNMIPVVDMKNNRSIYQEDDEFGKVNVWEKFYCQPGGVSLEDAINSNNYIIGDTSHNWFCYVRNRYPKKIKDENFLRVEYNKYIRLQPNVIELCEQRLKNILPDKSKERLIAICLRGTDYKQFHHMVQPKVKDTADLAKKIYKEYNCDYYFIATEDAEIYEALKHELPLDKVVTFNAGNIESDCKGLIGLQIRNEKSAQDASLDYLTTLYIINKSVCLIGGLCGATIVAKYRKNPPYEYVNIIDLHCSY